MKNSDLSLTKQYISLNPIPKVIFSKHNTILFLNYRNHTISAKAIFFFVLWLFQPRLIIKTAKNGSEYSCMGSAVLLVGGVESC